MRTGLIVKNAKTEISRFKKATLRTLSRCKQTGQRVKVASPALGDGEFISSVEDIYQSGTEEIVVLKWRDNNNFAFLTHLFLEEIMMVNAQKNGYSSRVSFS